MAADGACVVSSVFCIPLEPSRSTALGNRSTGPGERWVLREFVADKENALIRVVSDTLAEDEPRYNPILIYGPSGTGKSLLANGLASRWKKSHARSRVILTSGTDYVRHYAAAVDTDSVAEFRTRYRQASLVVVDGIHQLAGHLAAQNEFIGLLDQAVQRRRQLLATSRQLPSEVGELLPGLASRLSAGLSVPLRAPSVAARQVIIERLAETRRLELPAPAIRMLAEGNPATPHFLSTVPQLDQALQQLTKIAQLTGTSIDEDLVRRFLHDESPARRTTLRSIASHVARHFQIKSTDMRGATRRQHVVRARGIAMFLARQLTDKSLQQVGEFFGNRDHSTVLYSCRKTESLIQSDPSMHETVQQLTELICRS